MAGPVVTIARQLGSGGDEVAAEVASRLGVPLLDREIIARAAQQAGVSEEALQNAQRSSSLLGRMLESLGKFGTAGGEGVALEGFSSSSMLTTSADYRALVEQVLRDMATSGPCVILGHVGQVALRDAAGVLHVFVRASAEYRASRLSRTQRMPLQRAKHEIEANDRDRVRFYRTAYQLDWYDLRLYDAVVDTELLGLEGAVEVIVDLAQRAMHAPVAERPAIEETAVPPRTPTAAIPSAKALELDGAKVRIRPMTSADAGALLALFRSLPTQDLLFLRRDVTNERVLEAWARDVADGRIVTLLAETPDGDVVGEASMYPNEVPWTRHVAEVRVITSPTMRSQGLGRALLQEIMQSAHAAGIVKLTAEMTVEQAGARRLFESVGFQQEGLYRDYARDQSGQAHDLLVMTHTT